MCGPALRKCVVLFAVVGLVALSGCSSLNPLSRSELPEGLAEAPATYRVEMHSDRGEPKIFDGQLSSSSGAPVTVQSALEASGAIKKYKRMEINVYRRVADTGRGLKLPVEFDHKTNSVRVEQDYALHPGDRIVINPVSGDLLTLMFGSLSDTGF